MEQIRAFLQNTIGEMKSFDEIETICQKMKRYMEEILEWNEKVNLTAIVDKEEFVQKHLIDSMGPIVSDEIRSAKDIIDVGTGAGFPGIPLALIFPEKKFVLLDATRKKMDIVREVSGKLAIENIEVIHGRAEEIARKREYRDQFDMAVSRAVANMTTLAEYCLPFVRKDGYFVAYKGPEIEKEMEASGEALKELKGEVAKIETFSGKASPTKGEPAPEGTFNHKIVYIRKTDRTPKAYPRKTGMPGKEPIEGKR